MRISGFTILRNAVDLGYPFEESIRSLLPLVDELVVAVGESTDRTWEAVCEIRSPKIHAFRTTWNIEEMGASVLSYQTNLALERCTGDWAIYLQADEVLHEDDLERLRGALRHHLKRRTEGLLFDYLHFFGSYGWIADDWRWWYPKAFRAVKVGIGVMSVGDGAGFRIRRHGRMRGLIGASCGARIFHYGWCRAPDVMSLKQTNLENLFRSKDAPAQPAPLPGTALWTSRDPGHLRPFRGAHPGDMADRIAAQRWSFDPADIAAGKDRRRRRRFISRGEYRDLVKYFVPQGMKNICWRGADLWRSIRARRGSAPAG